MSTTNIETMSKLEEFRTYFLLRYENFDHKEMDKSGFIISLPTFELYAQDYLEFAEQELFAYQNNTKGKDNRIHLINCLSHLKRAMDCQSDTFLHAFNLYNIFSKRNLKFEKKLEFFDASGIFGSRSLTRLNIIRNRMEHDYEFPKLEDIEVYYDLVASFIAVLQRTMIAFKDIQAYITDERERILEHIKITYHFDGPKIEAEWGNWDKNENISYTMNEYKEFAFLFRVLLLMEQGECFASIRYITSQINKYHL